MVISPATQEQMREAYEAVRESGRTNMFDVEAVIRIAKELKSVVLTREDVFEIMKNYN